MLQTIANSAAVAMANVALIHSLEATARQAEEARAEMERATEQKTRFLAACSHDLRQPFQAMRLFHQILIDQAIPGQHQVVTRLGEAMAHGEDLLNALLEVSTIDGGFVELRPEAVVLQDILDRLGVLFGDAARAQGVRLAIVASSLQVTTDPVQLTRMLVNLVGNALKFSPQGKVVVGARRMEGRRVRIDVCDNGTGIAAQHLGAIFEDFYQVENQERDRRRGIGLGLGIVRRLSARLDHPITVKSHPGRGSVFAITLPVAPDAESGVPPSA